MAEKFDPYYTWLGIPPEDQPPDHYALLGVRQFESNPDVISNLTDQRMTHVKTFQTGPHGADSQRLLNEIAAARVCLLNPEKRKAYDARLRAQIALATAPEAQPLAAAPEIISPPPVAPPPIAPPASAAQSDSVSEAFAFIAAKARPVAAGGDLAAKTALQSRAKQRARARWLFIAAPILGIAAVVAAITIRNSQDAEVADPAAAPKAVTTALAPGGQNSGPAHGSSSSGEPSIAKSQEDAGRGAWLADSNAPTRQDAIAPPKPNDQAAVVDNTEPSSNSPQNSSANDGSAKPAPAPAAPSEGQFPLGQSVDVLRLVDTNNSKMVVEGSWSRNGEEITVEPGKESRATVPVVLNGSYDLEVEFTRTSGNNCVGIMLPIGSGSCMAVLSGYGGGISGLWCVNGVGPDNPRNPVSLRPGSLENNHRHRVAVSVRLGSEGHASVDVSLDGNPYFPHWDGNPAALDNQLPWQMPHPNELGLGANDSVTFHSARLKRISGSASLDSTLVPAAPPPAAINSDANSDAGFFVARPEESSANRSPVPNDTARQAALARLKERLEDDYSNINTIADRSALAQKLQRLAASETEDKDMRYVILTQSLEQAIAVGDVHLGSDIVAELCKSYAVDAWALRAETLAQVGRSSNSSTAPAVQVEIARAALALVENAHGGDRWGSPAAELARLGLGIRTGTYDGLSLRTRAAEVSEQIRRAKLAAQSVPHAREILAEAPDNPDANLAVGGFLCFQEDNWKEGLPYLAKGHDFLLRKFATTELSLPSTPADQFRLAEGWWTLAGHKSAFDPWRKPMRGRALLWYHTSVSGLTGPDLETAKQRIAGEELPAVARPAGKPARSAAGSGESDDRATKPWESAAFQQWMHEVAALPAEEQVQAVVKRLQGLNPGFDGKETHEVVGGVVTGLRFLTNNVTDISPVRALPGLSSLACCGGDRRIAVLSDLSPLRGMHLAKLDAVYSKVFDLSPLRGMPLTDLSCAVAPVSDLSPLGGMQLTRLHCEATSVSDLSPLKGMPLREMFCGNTKVTDLLPLQGMRLNYLSCSNTPVSDLSPLKGMPLTLLTCEGTQVSDLSPLEGMDLDKVYFTPKNISKGLDVLHTMGSVRKIGLGWGGKPEFAPDIFWKKYDAGEFK